jgi:hypothetical protein
LAPACAAFEAAISRYVDGETQGLDHERVVVHLHGCESCRGFAESLRRMADLHRVAAGAAPRALPGVTEARVLGAEGDLERLFGDSDAPAAQRPGLDVPGLESGPGLELPLPDVGAEFAALARRLYEENVSLLAGVCYELGKAYILAGTGQLGVRLVASRPSRSAGCATRATGSTASRSIWPGGPE